MEHGCQATLVGEISAHFSSCRDGLKMSDCHVCVECGHRVDSLYRVFSARNIQLLPCVRVQKRSKRHLDLPPIIFITLIDQKRQNLHFCPFKLYSLLLINVISTQSTRREIWESIS
jgi:hypothetical protein